jgi:hypothetical protein
MVDSVTAPVRKRPLWLSISFTVVGLLAVLAVLFFVQQYFSSKNLSAKLPQDTSSIQFTDAGVAERFHLSGFSLLAEMRMRVAGATVLESQPSSVEGEKIVLVMQPDVPGTTLGVVYANGNFEPLVADGTFKTDLVVTRSGVAVYSVASSPVIWESAVDASVEEEEATAPDEVGTADGPVNLGLTPTPITSGGTLFALDVSKDKTPRSLGAGKNPRLLEDGTLIAITPDGVEKINATTGSHQLLLAYTAGDAVGSTISADGTVALLRSEGNSVSDAYAIANGKATAIGSIVSLVPTFGASFADSSHIFLRTGRSSVALYLLPEDTAALKPPTAHLSIIAPQ